MLCVLSGCTLLEQERSRVAAQMYSIRANMHGIVVCNPQCALITFATQRHAVQEASVVRSMREKRYHDWVSRPGMKTRKRCVKC